MIEKNDCICKRCLELKSRIQDGKYGESKNKRWRDSEGKLWRGKLCPECHKLEMSGRMRKTRKKDDHAESINK